MTQLEKSSFLQLPHAFASEPHDRTDLLQRHRFVAIQTEVESKDVTLAIIQVFERSGNLIGYIPLEEGRIRPVLLGVGEHTEQRADRRAGAGIPGRCSGLRMPACGRAGMGFPAP